jgi:membrane-associated phospholipid phosphatase
VSVLLLKALGFIESIYLKTQKDRIIPYIACGIFFFWAFTVFKEQTKYPIVLVVFILGIFLASSAALLANIYFKVSMHAIGMGGLLGIFAVLFYNNNLSMAWPLALVLIVSGLVCTARLLLNTHTPKDIYVGLLIGIATQIAANYFL